MQGWRNTMEDSHVAHLDVDKGVSVFGVFDGHGGKPSRYPHSNLILLPGREVALFVKEKFIEIFKQTAGFKSRDWAAALKETFISIDKQLGGPDGQKQLVKFKAPDEGASSLFGRPESDNIAMYTGCTASVAVITDTEVICGNCGDSRTVVSKSKRVIELSQDHKPDNPGEKARIEKAGGFVEENRVKGVLNLSRSMGDLEYKQDPKLSVDD